MVCQGEEGVICRCAVKDLDQVFIVGEELSESGCMLVDLMSSHVVLSA